MRPLLAVLVLLTAVSAVAAETQKARLVVMTDVTNEPDDEQSLVRLLVYSNEYDLEGIIATTSCWLQEGIRPESIVQRIQAYGQVRELLLKHAPGFPTKEHLLSVTRPGVPGFGMKAVGQGCSTPGSNHIIEVVDKQDSRPVWISIWGGANTLAQALWDVKNSRSAADVDRFVDKLYVYDIAGQDDAGAWICKTFPTICYLRSVQQFRAISAHVGKPSQPEVVGPDGELFSPEWVAGNVQSHGPLGKLYPNAAYIHEGDTPAFMHLIHNGLCRPDQFTFGSWGGRFNATKTKNAQCTGRGRFDQEPYRDYYMVTEAADTWTHGSETYNSVYAPVFRWRRAFQHDFAARMDWTVADAFDKANHNPVAAFDGNLSKDAVVLNVESGQQVELSARGSKDPDHDRLAFRWFYYPEPGNLQGDLPIDNALDQTATVTVPEVTQPTTAHIILEVTDDGQPSLSSYRRVLLRIRPRHGG